MPLEEQTIRSILSDVYKINTIIRKDNDTISFVKNPSDERSAAMDELYTMPLSEFNEKITTNDKLEEFCQKLNTNNQNTIKAYIDSLPTSSGSNDSPADSVPPPGSNQTPTGSQDGRRSSDSPPDIDSSSVRSPVSQDDRGSDDLRSDTDSSTDRSSVSQDDISQPATQPEPDRTSRDSVDLQSDVGFVDMLRDLGRSIGEGLNYVGRPIGNGIRYAWKSTTAFIYEPEAQITTYTHLRALSIYASSAPKKLLWEEVKKDNQKNRKFPTWANPEMRCYSVTNEPNILKIYTKEGETRIDTKNNKMTFKAHGSTITKRIMQQEAYLEKLIGSEANPHIASRAYLKSLTTATPKTEPLTLSTASNTPDQDTSNDLSIYTPLLNSTHTDLEIFLTTVFTNSHNNRTRKYFEGLFYNRAAGLNSTTQIPDWMSKDVKRITASGVITTNYAEYKSTDPRYAALKKLDGINLLTVTGESKRFAQEHLGSPTKPHLNSKLAERYPDDGLSETQFNKKFYFDDAGNFNPQDYQFGISNFDRVSLSSEKPFQLYREYMQETHNRKNIAERVCFAQETGNAKLIAEEKETVLYKGGSVDKVMLEKLKDLGDESHKALIDQYNSLTAPELLDTHYDIGSTSEEIVYLSKLIQSGFLEYGYSEHFTPLYKHYKTPDSSPLKKDRDEYKALYKALQKLKIPHEAFEKAALDTSNTYGGCTVFLNQLIEKGDIPNAITLAKIIGQYELAFMMKYADHQEIQEAFSHNKVDDLINHIICINFKEIGESEGYDKRYVEVMSEDTGIPETKLWEIYNTQQQRQAFTDGSGGGSLGSAMTPPSSSGGGPLGDPATTPPGSSDGGSQPQSTGGADGGFPDPAAASQDEAPPTATPHDGSGGGSPATDTSSHDAASVGPRYPDINPQDEADRESTDTDAASQDEAGGADGEPQATDAASQDGSGGGSPATDTSSHDAASVGPRYPDINPQDEADRESTDIDAASQDEAGGADGEPQATDTSSHDAASVGPRYPDINPQDEADRESTDTDAASQDEAPPATDRPPVGADGGSLDPATTPPGRVDREPPSPDPAIAPTGNLGGGPPALAAESPVGAGGEPLDPDAASHDRSGGGPSAGTDNQSIYTRLDEFEQMMTSIMGEILAKFDGESTGQNPRSLPLLILDSAYSNEKYKREFKYAKDLKYIEHESIPSAFYRLTSHMYCKDTTINQCFRHLTGEKDDLIKHGTDHTRTFKEIAKERLRVLYPDAPENQLEQKEIKIEARQIIDTVHKLLDDFFQASNANKDTTKFEIHINTLLKTLSNITGHSVDELGKNIWADYVLKYSEGILELLDNLFHASNVDQETTGYLNQIDIYIDAMHVLTGIPKQELEEVVWEVYNQQQSHGESAPNPDQSPPTREEVRDTFNNVMQEFRLRLTETDTASKEQDDRQDNGKRHPFQIARDNLRHNPPKTNSASEKTKNQPPPPEGHVKSARKEAERINRLEAARKTSRPGAPQKKNDTP